MKEKINSKRTKPQRRRIKSNKSYCAFCKEQKNTRPRGMGYYEILYHLESRHKDEYLETSDGNKTNKDIIDAFKLLYGLGFLKF